eukprot:2461982-Rhodomonas_salina.1
MVLMASSDAQAEQSAELGCTGTLRSPLKAAQLAQELRAQDDAKELWLKQHVINSVAAPVSDAVSLRVQALRERMPEPVRTHPTLAALSLAFHVQVLDASSDTMLRHCELVLKRVEELVGSAAAQHGALVSEAAGDRFTVVTGFVNSYPSSAEEPVPSFQASLSAAYQVALHVMRRLRQEQQNLDDAGIKVALRAGVSSGQGYEGLVGCSQQQLAFFGLPVAEAVELSALAEAGQIGI